MGGNVQIGDVSAERIDLKRLNRSAVVAAVENGLRGINNHFKKQHGFPIWADRVLTSKGFLSGSALHFFDLNKISDEEFAKNKPTVGDIDTQVDMLLKGQVENMLLRLVPGTNLNGLVYVGYKASGEQLITLWNLAAFNINVQVDLELVPYKDDVPTEWSAFAHSSSWDDIKNGIKGVFQKYAIQSLVAPKMLTMIQKAKTSRGKDKIMTRGTHSFSVSHGVIEKMVPVTDTEGKHIHHDGVPEYKELGTNESKGTTDLRQIFIHYFGKEPSASELTKFASFIGIIELVKTHFSKDEWVKIADLFSDKLWEKGAQGLYRGNPAEDMREKMVAMRYMADKFGIDVSKYDAKINDYYKAYKV